MCVVCNRVFLTQQLIYVVVRARPPWKSHVPNLKAHYHWFIKRWTRLIWCHLLLRCGILSKISVWIFAKLFPFLQQTGQLTSDHDVTFLPLTKNSRLLTQTSVEHFLLYSLRIIVCYMENKLWKWNCMLSIFCLKGPFLATIPKHDASKGPRSSRPTL